MGRGYHRIYIYVCTSVCHIFLPMARENILCIGITCLDFHFSNYLIWWYKYRWRSIFDVFLICKNGYGDINVYIYIYVGATPSITLYIYMNLLVLLSFLCVALDACRLLLVHPAGAQALVPHAPFLLERVLCLGTPPFFCSRLDISLYEWAFIVALATDPVPPPPTRLLALRVLTNFFTHPGPRAVLLAHPQVDYTRQN